MCIRLRCCAWIGGRGCDTSGRRAALCDDATSGHSNASPAGSAPSDSRGRVVARLVCLSPLIPGWPSDVKGPASAPSPGACVASSVATRSSRPAVHSGPRPTASAQRCPRAPVLTAAVCVLTAPPQPSMSVAFDHAPTNIAAANEGATVAASPPTPTAAAALSASSASAAAPPLHRLPTLSACARYEEHLWKKDICKQCGRIKDKHTLAALRPVMAEATTGAIWYVRPSEIMRQQGRKVAVPHLAPPPVDLSNDARSLAANAAKPAEPAGAGIGSVSSSSESKPTAAMLSPPRHAHVVSEVDAMSPVGRRDSTHSRYPKSLASLPTRSFFSATNAEEAGALDDEAASPTSADAQQQHAQDSSSSSAVSPQPHARGISNSTPLHAPVAVTSPAPVPLAISLTMLDGQTVATPHDEDEVSQYDGSVSSSIVDHARSPAPVLRHEGGGRSLGEYNHPDDEPFSLERYDTEQSDSGPSDSDETDDSTESGMSAEQIQALLSRLSPTAAQATAGAAAAHNLDGSAKRGPKKSILVVRRRSSTRSAGATTASVGASSSHRSRRPPKSVSFNSCVLIREYGRVQGGSTSVTRSGQYSLGLDWSVQRELMAPLELSIETIAEKRRQQSERLEAQSESDAAAAAALTDTLPPDDDDEQLLTEPDPEYDEDGNVLSEDASMFVGIRSPAGSTTSLASMPVIDDVLSADASSSFDDITIAAYKLQPLKLHKRYPSNNKDEEMQRISEEGRVRLFQRYVQVEESTSPVEALAAAAAAEATPESPASESFDVAAAALRSVLADPRVFDESSELEFIRDSRGANFCTCHPPKGRLGAMLMNLTDSEVAALPLSDGNTCCSDDSCACFRAGVGCHVESDHYCLCAGSFVERIRAARKQTEEEQEQEEEEEEV